VTALKRVLVMISVPVLQQEAVAVPFATLEYLVGIYRQHRNPASGSFEMIRLVVGYIGYT